MSWLRVHLIATGGVATLPPALAACLPPAERERAMALRRPQDRINRLVAYAALFKLAAEQAGLPVHTLALQRDAHGKPQLQLPAGCPPLHANLSHSGQWVAIALASNPVGVDVECVRDFDWQQLRRAHFANDAWPKDVDPTLAFHQLWCSKEAVLKVTGRGLGLPPSQLTLHPPSSDFQPLRTWPEGSGLEHVRVALLNAPASYAAAAAVLTQDTTASSQRQYVLRPPRISCTVTKMSSIV